MKIDREKLDMAMARKCMSVNDIVQQAAIPRGTFNGLFKRQSIRPATIGKIARALEIDPADLLAEEDNP